MAQVKLTQLPVEKARQRQAQAGKIYGRGQNSLSSNELKLSDGQARDPDFAVCPHCGKIMPVQLVYCWSCGLSLEVTQQ